MKLLLADDDALNRTILSRLLQRWGYEVITARDGVESWNELERDDAPKLAIIDWLMPGLSGIELCHRIRTEKQQSYTYVLLVTSNCGREDLIAGLEAGADDYITKPCDPTELKLRLRAGRRILELQEALRAQALRDPLTRAWNRRGVLELLGCELTRIERQHRPMALVLCDIDHFKRINDTHGHQVGDEVLAEFADRLMRVTRSYDGVGRYGGEEFMILVPGCAPEDAPELGERLRAAVATEPIRHAGALIAVTASFGIAVSEGGVSQASLIHAADMALYRAKEGGRNRVEIAAFPRPSATAERDDRDAVVPRR